MFWVWPFFCEMLTEIILFGSDFSYRLNPSSKLPDWYTPVNLIEDKRRWSAD